jgi:hypothetical protein
MYEDAIVYTSDRKKIGKVAKVDTNYLIVYKKGLIGDEEFRIPVAAVSTYNTSAANTLSITLNLKEEEIKHGFEYATDHKPNSDIVSGKSDIGYQIPLKKQVVHYEAFPQFEEKEAPSSYSSSTDKLPNDSQYICDMCMEKFDDSRILQKHRADKHSTPTGV